MKDDIKNNVRVVKTVTIPIRWSDIDSLGHVNNSCYFSYFEQARIEWLKAIDYSLTPGKPTGPVLVNAHCSFLHELTFPGDIDVTMSLGEPGRSSFMSYYQLYKSGNTTRLCAEGAAKVVWVDYRAKKSIPLPDFIRNLILA